MEVLTVQIGHFSNFVGSHFWNFQSNQLVQELNDSGNVFATFNPLVADDASDPNLLCRETIDKFGRNILVPRLLAIDLKGSLNVLKEDGTKGKEAVRTEELDKFAPNIEVIDSGSHCPQENLENQAAFTQHNRVVWSDFLATQYHPKSIFLVEDYAYDPGVGKFNNYGSGLNTVKNVDQIDALEDKLHFFLEECDSPQGLQVICDLHDGFGGYSSGLLDQFRDIAGKIPVFTFANWPFDLDCGFTALNSSLSLNNIAQSGDLVFPLSLREKISTKDCSVRSFPFVLLKETSLYETSAIHASFIDTVTLPFRTKKSNVTTMNGLSSFVTIGNQHVVACGLSLPFTASSLRPEMQGQSESYLTSITPYSNCFRYHGAYGELVVVRGRKRIERFLAKTGQKGSRSISAHIDEEHQWILDSSFESYTAKKLSFDSCLSTLPPFPQFFQPCLLGDFMTTEAKVGNEGFSSVASVSKVAPTRSLYDLFFNVYMEARLVSRPHLTSFLESGMELSDVKESLEELLCLAESYDPSRKDFSNVDTRNFKF